MITELSPEALKAQEASKEQQRREQAAKEEEQRRTQAAWKEELRLQEKQAKEAQELWIQAELENHERRHKARTTGKAWQETAPRPENRPSSRQARPQGTAELPPRTSVPRFESSDNPHDYRWDKAPGAGMREPMWYRKNDPRKPVPTSTGAVWNDDDTTVGHIPRGNQPPEKQPRRNKDGVIIGNAKNRPVQAYHPDDGKDRFGYRTSYRGEKSAWEAAQGHSGLQDPQLFPGGPRGGGGRPGNVLMAAPLSQVPEEFSQKEEAAKKRTQDMLNDGTISKRSKMRSSELGIEHMGKFDDNLMAKDYGQRDPLGDSYANPDHLDPQGRLGGHQGEVPHGAEVLHRAQRQKQRPQSAAARHDRARHIDLRAGGYYDGPIVPFGLSPPRPPHLGGTRATAGWD